MAQASKLSYSGGGDHKDQSEGSPGKKFSISHLINGWPWWHMSVIPAMWGNTNRRIMTKDRV
jgi:hypothetical protein